MSKRSTSLAGTDLADMDRQSSPVNEERAEIPPAKRVKENPPAGGAKGAPGAPGGQEIDPNELGDVLNAAGVDLREEESLLNSGLSEQGGIAGARLLHAPKERDYETMLLNFHPLKRTMTHLAAESGLKLAQDEGTTASGLNQDPISLICASCEEWLSVILQEAAAYSRHRRLSRNPTSLNEQSELSRSLRDIMQKDRVRDSKHEAVKERLGLTQEQAPDDKDSEERTQRAANDTARMMTQNIGRKKKFSWMSDNSNSGGGGPPRSGAAARRQNNDPNRFKEIREDSGIVMRDVLPALERKHMGVKRALIKSYSRLRN